MRIGPSFGKIHPIETSHPYMPFFNNFKWQSCKKNRFAHVKDFHHRPGKAAEARNIQVFDCI
jgi:hypothetical protein